MRAMASIHKRSTRKKQQTATHRKYMKLHSSSKGSSTRRSVGFEAVVGTLRRSDSPPSSDFPFGARVNPTRPKAPTDAASSQLTPCERTCNHNFLLSLLCKFQPMRRSTWFLSMVSAVARVARSLSSIHPPCKSCHHLQIRQWLLASRQLPVRSRAPWPPS